ncbi:hypothetical protein [Streptomyces sp. NPDC059783]|uniref:hypothetical protein n=1 Tax=Streptomyces sp. NPDC059783 TaxID=3346944 RepID=UPI0036524C26
MGTAVMLFLAAPLVCSCAAGVVAVLRCRRPASPPQYLRYRPEREPAVVTAEALVSDTYQVLRDLYLPPDPAPRR